MAHGETDAASAAAARQAPRRSGRLNRARRRQLGDLLHSFAQELSSIEGPAAKIGIGGATSYSGSPSGSGGGDSADVLFLASGADAGSGGEEAVGSSAAACSSSKCAEGALHNTVGEAFQCQDGTSTMIAASAAAAAAAAVAAASGSAAGARRKTMEAAATAAADGSGAGVAAVADVSIVKGRGGTPATSKAEEEDTTAALALRTIRAMAQDYTVLKCNVRDYDAALRAVLGEVRQLRVEVSRVDSARATVAELQEFLNHETKAQQRLRERNASLATRNSELTSLIRASLSATGDEESEAFIDALLTENTMLWRMVQTSQSANRASGIALSAPLASPLPQRHSLSSRTRSSPGSTPSRLSPGRSLAADSPRSAPQPQPQQTAQPMAAAEANGASQQRPPSPPFVPPAQHPPQKPPPQTPVAAAPPSPPSTPPAPPAFADGSPGDLTLAPTPEQWGGWGTIGSEILGEDVSGIIARAAATPPVTSVPAASEDELSSLAEPTTEEEEVLAHAEEQDEYPRELADERPDEEMPEFDTEPSEVEVMLSPMGGHRAPTLDEVAEAASVGLTGSPTVVMSALEVSPAAHAASPLSPPVSPPATRPASADAAAGGGGGDDVVAAAIVADVVAAAAEEAAWGIGGILSSHPADASGGSSPTLASGPASPGSPSTPVSPAAGAAGTGAAGDSYGGSATAGEAGGDAGEVATGGADCRVGGEAAGSNAMEAEFDEADTADAGSDIAAAPSSNASDVDNAVAEISPALDDLESSADDCTVLLGDVDASPCESPRPGTADDENVAASTLADSSNEAVSQDGPALRPLSPAAGGGGGDSGAGPAELMLLAEVSTEDAETGEFSAAEAANGSDAASAGTAGSGSLDAASGAGAGAEAADAGDPQ